jgi:hypothetical protein
VKLKPGSILSLDITPRGTGFGLQVVLRAGRSAKPKGAMVTVSTLEELYMAVEDFGRERLARLGLDKVKP